MKKINLWILLLSFAFAKQLSVDELNLACEKKDYGACHNLGLVYLNSGEISLAKQYFEKACSNKMSQSCFSLGLLYESGVGLEVDKFRAFEYFEKSCLSKEAIGCDKLAWYYEEGEAVRYDMAKALEIYDKNCKKQKGYKSCMRLGEIYSKGLEGVEKDGVKAIEYLDVACEGKFEDSCEIISQLYFQGEICDSEDENATKKCVEKDINLAIKYLDKACNNGKSEACIELGLEYLNGGVVDINTTISKEYFGKACDFKNENGCKTYKMMIKEGM
ncbi:MAG: sel1 repeat family protein [Campylobacteraceae bacterium]|nr:sel1 repeat family protein [Campylobacteraceae bacterium]